MIYFFDDFTLNSKKFELRQNEEVLHIEPLVFDLIYFFVQNPNRIIDRDEMIENVWKGRIVSDTTISTCIKSARKALGDNGESQIYIKTIRGRGIEFTAEVKTKEDDNKSITDADDKADVPVAAEETIHPFSFSQIAFAIISLLVLIIIFMFFNQQKNDDASNQIAQNKTIAVMPFIDLSETGDQEYFGDGMTEEVLNLLTSVDELKVTSRTTAFSLKGQNLTIPEIAEKLDVNYVVEGSIRSANNRVRVTAQLIDVNSDSHLWSETYDRELNDIFSIQDEISLSIINALKITLIDNEVNHRTPTNNMEAYKLYLQGHQLFLNRGTDDLTKSLNNIVRAIDLLEQAVALDPNFAEAWADLATSTIILPSYSARDYSFQQIAPKANDAANRAISLNPGLSQAWAVKGFIDLNRYQFQDAEIELLRATELDTKNETAWLWLGLHYVSVGNQENALEAIEKAIELAPTVAINYAAKGMALHGKGDVDTAISLMDMAINEMGFEAGRPDRALAAMWKNDPERAKQEMNGFLSNFTGIDGERFKYVMDVYAKAYFDPSYREEGLGLLSEVINGGSLPTFGLYTLLDGAMVVHVFENTPANKGFILGRIYYPIARPLFKQQIFKDYLKQIGLLSYWQNNKFPEFCSALGNDDFECN